MPSVLSGLDKSGDQLGSTDYCFGTLEARDLHSSVVEYVDFHPFAHEGDSDKDSVRAMTA